MSTEKENKPMEKLRMPERKDICYGPIAAGQWFIDRMNPDTPIIYKINGTYSEHMKDLFICETWGMHERSWDDGWIFSKDEYGGGVQIHVSNLERMERVSKGNARRFAEQRLRHRDDEWRGRWGPDHKPIKIVRCSCGVGDQAERGRHTMHCFCRGEFD